MTDLTHLGGRVARDAGTPDDGTVTDGWGGPRIPAHVPVIIDAYAADYARLVTEGGTGGQAHGLLNRLRHDPPEGFDIWRFTEAVAGRLPRKNG